MVDKRKTNSHHVTFNKEANQWQGKRAGAERASVVGDTKSEVVKKTREISKNQGTELKIHNKDGKISQSDSHGNAPCPPKDKK